MNSIAREVNRRLGLSDDSVVGKTMVASASVGANIPLTQIGGRIAQEGRHVNQERLESAYEQARKAVASSQLTEGTALVKEFRASDVYQWANAGRVAGTSSFDSAYREAVERQSTSEQAYTQAKEMSRAAQFMREWGSGAQTDFTNYAARRLAERGLLREDDPAKLQRAVSEIAHGYAKGGNVGNQFIPKESPMQPTSPLADILGWSSSGMPGKPSEAQRVENTEVVTGAAGRNKDAIRSRQTRLGLTPGQSVGNDVSASAEQRKAASQRAIESTREQVTHNQGTLSEDYNARASTGAINRHHNGNSAVWNTVGAQANNRADIGEAPPKPTIPKWQLGKDGVPSTPSRPKVDKQ